MNRIGFMQGRLSPQVNGMIQAFPWEEWRAEFPSASGIGIHVMEWTLDQHRLYDNPLMTSAGQREIAELKKRHEISIPSLTGDCFMQAPFWKHPAERAALVRDLRAIIRAARAVGIGLVLIPLVDGGRIESSEQNEDLREGLASVEDELSACGIRITFESDFEPRKLAEFIEGFDPKFFGLTFDIGNSASMGFDFEEEIAAYGSRILNVHIKDRMLHGTTVPLGTGNAKLSATIRALEKSGYRGNYILQTARAPAGEHAAVLSRYKAMAETWLAQSA